MDTTGPLASVAEQISIETWTSPDVLRALLVYGDTDVTAVPSWTPR